MREKHKFSKAVYFGFAAMMLLYLPIAIGGYALFGQEVKDNVLDNVDKSIFHTLINAFMAFHLFCAYLIVINPLNLDLEKRLNIKHCS
jgi:vesicular inhibitory amino acid transporter